MTNPLLQLTEAGQSVWLDYMRRGLVDNGDFEHMIHNDALSGVTSNPAIFEKAITGSCDYRGAIGELVQSGVQDAEQLYEELAVDDIRRSADVFRPVYERTGGHDGYVSLEVSPHLAYDAERTCEQARRLWTSIGRPNAMIKVPATPQGLVAIETLLSEGININVTLLFAPEVYEQVAEAHTRALEQRLARGEPISHVASVASFFISRIDSEIDKVVNQRIEAGARDDEAARLRGLKGQIAIANAKRAYRLFGERTSSARWRALAAEGARPQRLLWASTSTKNPALSDVYYLESLIGPETVTTVPPATYDAFRDHGTVRRTLDTGVEQADALVREADALGISLERVARDVLEQGVDLFVEAFDRLIASVDEVRAKAAVQPAPVSRSLPAALEQDITYTLDEWQRNRTARRIWARDATLWTGDGENEWLGWLCVTEDHDATAVQYAQVAALAREGEFGHVLLLGMGGSSLCPEVLTQSFGRIDGFPELLVLDSTDPAQVRRTHARIDVERTLFVVSSKSGGTLEPNLFLDYFWDCVRERAGVKAAGARFVAITDPGSPLEARARELGFRAVYHGVPSIGGRYSALSPFGLVPAALMGLDVRKLLDRADEAAQACSGCVPAHDNPGVVLGVVLGLCARHGRDKLTLIVSPAIASFGAWLEQLVAESTGKQGKAIVPVHEEHLGAPDVYGDDRVFVQIRLEEAPDADQDAAVARLRDAGQPVQRIDLRDRWSLASEMFRWEFATAVAGSVMGINPFDQPDVEASKVATREITQTYEREGTMPSESPRWTDDGSPRLTLYTDEANARELHEASGGRDEVRDVLRAHLGRLRGRDYFALLAYVEMSDALHEELQRIRHAVRDRRRVATSLGFGPRFLHSTGQAHKGGPDECLFLQVTWQAEQELPIPGHRASFDVVEVAQARGDFHVLTERGRRALHVHIDGDAGAGLRRLRDMVEDVLG